MRSAGVAGAVAGASALAGAAVFAYGVRGRSSTLFGPSVWRGSRQAPRIALTFDDGPSESTETLLTLLAQYRVPATFFQCGRNVRRLASVARTVAAERHEIGNHSETHTALYGRGTAFIDREFANAQRSIEDTIGARPSLLRAPFGARWFGFRAMQQRLKLLGVMWSVIGVDWRLPARSIATRVIRGTSNGAIICLHDGRELQTHPDVRATLEAVSIILPALRERGFEFCTVSNLLCPTN